MDHVGRLRRLQDSLSGHKLDWLLIAHLPNVHYLCGFTGSSAALLVAQRGSILFTDGRYRTQARDELRAARVDIRLAIVRISPTVAAGEWLAARSRRSDQALRIEAESTTVGARDRLAAALKKSKKKIRLRSAPPLVEQSRMIKD